MLKNLFTKRKIGAMLITVGALIAPDVVIPTFTDQVMSIPMAMFVAAVFSLEYLTALLAVFMFGFFLMFLGFYLIPGDTLTLIVNFFTSMVTLMLSNPLLLIATVFLLLVSIFVGDMMYSQLHAYSVMLIGGA